MSSEAPVLCPLEAATPGHPLSLRATVARAWICSCWHREGTKRPRALLLWAGLSLGTPRKSGCFQVAPGNALLSVRLPPPLGQSIPVLGFT